MGWGGGAGVSGRFHTHNWKASLNLADQLLFLDLVVNLRFLSARKGPTMQTSTKGRNIPDVCHFMSFTAMTARSREAVGQSQSDALTGGIFSWFRSMFSLDCGVKGIKLMLTVWPGIILKEVMYEDSLCIFNFHWLLPFFSSITSHLWGWLCVPSPASCPPAELLLRWASLRPSLQQTDAQDELRVQSALWKMNLFLSWADGCFSDLLFLSHI